MQHQAKGCPGIVVPSVPIGVVGPRLSEGTAHAARGHRQRMLREHGAHKRIPEIYGLSWIEPQFVAHKGPLPFCTNHPLAGRINRVVGAHALSRHVGTVVHAQCNNVTTSRIDKSDQRSGVRVSIRICNGLGVASRGTAASRLGVEGGVLRAQCWFDVRADLETVMSVRGTRSAHLITVTNIRTGHKRRTQPQKNDEESKRASLRCRGTGLTVVTVSGVRPAPGATGIWTPLMADPAHDLSRRRNRRGWMGMHENQNVF